MDRRRFLTYLGTIGVAGLSMKILSSLDSSFEENKQPLIFFGHGSPMNAIEDNEFSKSWKLMGQGLSPKAILVISAHWETRGTQVFSGKINKTIYDFYGFPKDLYDVKYPAPGNPSLAQSISKDVSSISQSESWGLDHGAWSVLVHSFPKADIPVIQLSLNQNLRIKEHFQLAKELKHLRNKGVLIIGSGNMVHNLRQVSWDNSKTYDWAEDIQSKILSIIQQKDFEKLVEISKDSNFNKAHPTIEHYLPLVYTFALAEDSDKISVTTPKIELGSISMASFLIKP